MVVEVRHVLGQHCREMAAADNQHPVQQFAADSSDPPFADRVRPGARTGVRRMRIPPLANTASKMPVNLPSWSRIKTVS
jgi:hypothetical protein